MQQNQTMHCSKALSLFLLLVAPCWAQEVDGGDTAIDPAKSELGLAAKLFSGPLEVVSDDPRFEWLESPLWSEDGQYLLFSDVKHQVDNITCGMLWKFSADDGLEAFLPCAGLVGPGDIPDNIADYVEAGPNGLLWGWNGDGDLLMAQHGKSRIVRIDVNDIVNGEIDPALVTALVDEYDGMSLNSPNDMYLADGVLHFTDPPFGLQLFSSNNSVGDAFSSMPQGLVGIYTIDGDPVDNTPAEPERIVEIRPSDPWYAPNGIAITDTGDIVTPITDFGDPRVHIRSMDDDGNYTLQSILSLDYRIEGNNSGYPALADGLTYSQEHDAIFVAGPGGVYIFSSVDSYELLGFLRVDDLNSNNVIGGGYLWITANQRLMRIPLAQQAETDDAMTTDSPTADPTSSGSHLVPKMALIGLIIVSVLF